MAIKINFDSSRQPEQPTFILALKNGDRLGMLNNISNIQVKDSLNDTPEISFTINKFNNGVVCNLWNEIRDFRLVWCKEWNTLFEITLSFEDDESVFKNVSLQRLAECELSQIYVYNLECNTEDDIARKDYDENNPTCIYDNSNHSRSLLHRLLENAPHYIIKSVDSSIAPLVRTFSFDGDDIKSCLDEIAEEIHCLVVYETYYNENDEIVRAISLKDLEANCLNSDCSYKATHDGKAYRGEFWGKCPHCNSTDIKEGYGNDTGIFVTKDSLADDISFETDTDSVKNCFRLIAGDDLMTETIVNCNPNGSRYLWYFSDKMKQDMPSALVDKIDDYNDLYAEYNNEHTYAINSSLVTAYNTLVTKYSSYDQDLEAITASIVGYANLIKAYYRTIDFALFLKSGLLPTWQQSDTTAQAQFQNLQTKGISPIAVTNLSYVSSSTVDSAITNYARLIIDKRYQVKVDNSTYDSSTHIWNGSLKITNYSDEEDTYTSSAFNVTINDDYETYVKYKVKDAVNDYVDSDNNYDIGSLFSVDTTLADFTTQLANYSLDHLVLFRDCCQAVINVLVEQGASDPSFSAEWQGTSSDVYTNIYLPYYRKLSAIEAEISVRTNEITTIAGLYWDTDTANMSEAELNEHNQRIKDLKTSNVVGYGIQRVLQDYVKETQTALNFESYLGTNLWLQFSAFRREDSYQNNNYISEGLDTNKLFANALEFLEKANKEIYKSATQQHKISTTLKNLLVIKEFEPLVESFQCGNWLRIEVEDEIYKLRLISYDLDYDDLDNISVEFSDVINTVDGITDVESILKQASSMASSYGNVTRQASNGNDGKAYMDKWFSDGLDLTKLRILGSAKNQNQVIDDKGILCRTWLNEVDQFDPIQTRIINGTIAVTDDNWETVKAAMGRFVYKDPSDNNKIKYGYGINGEVVVGKLILGQQLGIYNSGGSMSFDYSGLVITGNKNRVKFTPSSNNSVMTIKKMSSGAESDTIFNLDNDGNLELTGKITASANSVFGNWTVGTNAIYYNNANFQNVNGMYFGTSGLSLTDKFSVTSAGKLVGTDVDLTGKITASSGSITGSLNITGSIVNSRDKYSVTMRGVQSNTSYSVFYISEYADSSRTGTPTYPFRINGDGSVVGTKASFENLKVANKIYISDGLSSTYYRLAYHNSNADDNYPVRISPDEWCRFTMQTRIDALVVPEILNSPNVNGSIRVGGDDNDVTCGITAKFKGDTDSGHYILQRDDDGLTVMVGTNGSALNGNRSTTLKLRGNTITLPDGSAVTSDERVKTDFILLDKYDNFFDDLLPYGFKYAYGTSGRYHIGFKAQDIERALLKNNLTTQDFAGFIRRPVDPKSEDYIGYDDECGLRYNEFVALLVYEVQQLKAKVQQLTQPDGIPSV